MFVALSCFLLDFLARAVLGQQILCFLLAFLAVCFGCTLETSSQSSSYAFPIALLLLQDTVTFGRVGLSLFYVLPVLLLVRVLSSKLQLGVMALSSGAFILMLVGKELTLLLLLGHFKTPISTLLTFCGNLFIVILLVLSYRLLGTWGNRSW